MPADRFEIEPEQPETEKSILSGCLLGCLIVSGLVIVLLLAASWWLSSNWRDLTSKFLTTQADKALAESSLPEEEQQQIREQVDRLAIAVRDGEVGEPEAIRLFNAFVDSPLFSSLLVAGVEEGYLLKSGLADEEKEAGKVSLRRFVRGMVDGKIDESGFDQVMVHIADKRPDGGWEVRPEATDDELRAMIKTAQELADEAEVAAEPEEVDPSDELKRIVDEALLGEASAEVEKAPEVGAETDSLESPPEPASDEPPGAPEQTEAPTQPEAEPAAP